LAVVAATFAEASAGAGIVVAGGVVRVSDPGDVLDGKPTETFGDPAAGTLWIR
jgi:hypothetical protein